MLPTAQPRGSYPILLICITLRRCFAQVPSAHEHSLILPICYSSAHNSTSTSSAAEQYELSISRTSAYVEDPTASHVQHRYKSAKQSKESHITSIKAYLDDFDTTMATEAQKK
ncbi:hypothetical protein V8E51_019026 [Hyaloscypha variabilis]